MKFSAKFEYALLTLLHLNCEPDDSPVSGRAISEELGIPYRFLEQILGDLKKGGLVRSVRGNQGGYKLNADAEVISIYDVYEITDGKLVPWDCSVSESQDRCGKNLNQCVISQFYADFKETFRTLMKKHTLQSLCIRSAAMKREAAATSAK